ncbi:NAD-P-binding protein [Polyporus arcularius HHB13444]|uniref:NAD-P-binding protein n=2 Tax=Polyporaceae TaxID=5317 RepID=A0A5C3Q3U5_9APHY|nr:NAD-P-binding protein [Polyporus brumalis]TFK94888.1 NAD-P-binding protein [Polyporus arcularius HHB13444]
MGGFHQKVWLITGTSSGFGKRLVASVLSRGDCVIATARNLEKLRAVFPAPERSRLHLLQLDISDSAELVQQRVKEALAVWGRIDVVVNNAGYGVKAVLEEGGALAALTQFQTNLFGVLNVTNAVLPHMRERRSGTVVILGSRSAWRAEVSPAGLYAASKAAVHAVGETYASELRPFGIRVLIVAPGAFRTEGVHAYPATINTHVPAYDDMRNAGMARFAGIAGHEKGDPAKAMELVVDVVKGEGRAAGREWPLWLVLGRDAYVDVRAKTQKLLATMDAWEDVATDLEFDCDQ